jgi:hypothetical protein
VNVINANQDDQDDQDDPIVPPDVLVGWMVLLYRDGDYHGLILSKNL